MRCLIAFCTETGKELTSILEARFDPEYVKTHPSWQCETKTAFYGIRSRKYPFPCSPKLQSVAVGPLVPNAAYRSTVDYFFCATS